MERVSTRSYTNKKTLRVPETEMFFGHMASRIMAAAGGEWGRDNPWDVVAL